MFGTSLANICLFIYLQNKVRQSQIEFLRISTIEELFHKVHLLLFIRNNNPMFGTIFFFTNWEFYSQKYQQISIKISLFLAKSFVWNMSHK
jgi:hypothetical protein